MINSIKYVNFIRYIYSEVAKIMLLKELLIVQKKKSIRTIVRITADCPIIDPKFDR